MVHSGLMTTEERKLQHSHVPIAGDIASTSADLLFGESLRIYIPEAQGKSI